MHAVRWVIQSWMLCTICEWFCMNMLLSQSPKSDFFVQSILGYFQNRMWPFWMILNILFKVTGWVYHLNWNGSKYGLSFSKKWTYPIFEWFWACVVFSQPIFFLNAHVGKLTTYLWLTTCVHTEAASFPNSLRLGMRLRERFTGRRYRTMLMYLDAQHQETPWRRCQKKLWNTTRHMHWGTTKCPETPLDNVTQWDTNLYIKRHDEVSWDTN